MDDECGTIGKHWWWRRYFALYLVPGIALVAFACPLVGAVTSSGDVGDTSCTKPTTSSSQPASAPEAFTNSLGVTMILVKPGTFVMGSPPTEDDGPYHSRIEETQHVVTLSKPFYLARTEVTNGDYLQFLWQTGYDGFQEANEHYLAHWGKPVIWKLKKGDREAVLGLKTSRFWKTAIHFISWKNAVAFCRWISQREGRKYRLPTEAEWEYGCRAGSSDRFCFGDDEQLLLQYAWYKDNSGLVPCPVGAKRPNAWGFCDMHGNVWEYCQDYWAEYPDHPVVDPTGPAGGSGRVIRSGYFSTGPSGVRSARRSYMPETGAPYAGGFRIACDITRPDLSTTRPPVQPD